MTKHTIKSKNSRTKDNNDLILNIKNFVYKPFKIIDITNKKQTFAYCANLQQYHEDALKAKEDYAKDRISKIKYQNIVKKLKNLQMKRDKDLYLIKHSLVFTFDKYKVGTFPKNVLKEMVVHVQIQKL